MIVKTIEQINKEFMAREAGILNFTFPEKRSEIKTLTPKKDKKTNKIRKIDVDDIVFEIETVSDKKTKQSSKIAADNTVFNFEIEKEFVAAQATEPEKTAATKKKKSLISVLSSVIFYAVIIGVVVMAFVSAGKSSGPRDIFGYSYFTVLTKSMQSEIPKDSLVITKKTDPSKLRIGDTITFFKSASVTVTHKIVDIYENYDDSGVRGFKTQGVNNTSADPDIVFAGNVIGKVIFSVPRVGAMLAALSENLLFVFFILGLLLILSFSLQVLFRIRKEEKQTKLTENPGLSKARNKGFDINKIANQK